MFYFYLLLFFALFCRTDFVQVYTGCKRDCSVADLYPGTDYMFRVQATNEAGVS